MTDFSFLAERPNFEHAEYEKSQRKAIEHAVACGKGLIEAKRLVGHGDWLDWMIDNLDFGPRTAQRHMRIARNASRLTHLGSVHAALADLADPPKQQPDPFRPVKLDPFRDIPHHVCTWMGPWVASCPHCLVDVYPTKPTPPPPLDELRDLIADHRRGLITDAELYDRALTDRSTAGLSPLVPTG